MEGPGGKVWHTAGDIFPPDLFCNRPEDSTCDLSQMEEKRGFGHQGEAGHSRSLDQRSHPSLYPLLAQSTEKLGEGHLHRANVSTGTAEGGGVE